MAKKKKIEYYRVPDNAWLPLHFVRPRFKNNIENVLLGMAAACCRIKKDTCESFAHRLNAAIKAFPGNIDKTVKTINNWRTETPALFTFYVEDKETGITRSTHLAETLYEKQDLVQFFKQFLYSFQFPGGHIKPNEVNKLIKNNVKFKPAGFILKVLIAGNNLLVNENKKKMTLTAEEAAYCIFNDLRVTSGRMSPKEVAKIILENREKKLRYYNKSDRRIWNSKSKPLSKGDVCRYAGDILDYMVIASLLGERHGYYYINSREYESVEIFVNDRSFFHGYDGFYGRENIQNSELTKLEPLWFKYVESEVDVNKFRTDISSIVSDDESVQVVYNSQIADLLSNDDKTSKDIGDVGESLVLGHEKMTLKLANLLDLMKRVRIVDYPNTRPGFDIESYEAEGEHDIKRIEVKTTISKKKMEMYSFHMTEHEWAYAKDDHHYYVYRLMLSESDKILYILRDPHELMLNRKIDFDVHDGVDISFDASNFKPTELLLWKD